MSICLDKTNYTDLNQWKLKSEIKLSKIYLDENQLLLFHTTHMWQIRRRHLLIKVQFIGKIKDTVTFQILALYLPGLSLLSDQILRFLKLGLNPGFCQALANNQCFLPEPIHVTEWTLNRTWTLRNALVLLSNRP